MTTRVDAEKLIRRADALRNHHHPSDALDAYLDALQDPRLTGQPYRYAWHMAGVCHQMIGDYDMALSCYERALEDASDLEAGRLYRDMAESAGRLGDHAHADYLLNESLKLLAYRDHASEYACTIGFTARARLRAGKTQDALRLFRQADSLLSAADNPHYELYNKLAYASALAQAGRWWSSRRVARKALWLSFNYGGTAHRLRALALLTGGYRAEQYFIQRRSS